MSFMSYLPGGGGGSISGDRNRELSELRERCSALHKASDEANVERDRALAAKADTMKQVSTLHEEKSSLQERNAALVRELQACKDDLFRMQPMTQVPDSTIAQRFENLDNVICSWIDSEISQYIDEWESKYPNVDPKLFHHSGDSAIKTLLAQYPSSGGEHIVRSMIHRQFQKKLFGDRVFLFGLNTHLIDWLKLVEEHMSRLQPPREAATIRAWRSETLTSIATMPDFSAWIIDAGCQLAVEILKELGNVFRVVDGNQKSLDSFYNKVVTVAVQLAVSMHTSATSYVLEPRMSGNTKFQRFFIPTSHLGRYRMIDVATGKPLKSDSPVVPDRNGYIGEQILLLVPRMSRYDNDKQVLLVKKMILVELYNPLGHRRAATVDREG